MAAGEQGKSLKGGKACPCGVHKATGFSSEQGRGRAWQAAFGRTHGSGGDIAEPPSCMCILCHSPQSRLCKVSRSRWPSRPRATIQ
jgi:hypothetical protein